MDTDVIITLLALISFGALLISWITAPLRTPEPRTTGAAAEPAPISA